MSESANTASNVVAEHYNKKNSTDLDTRSRSPIYFMRNFNNWIKSVLINEIIREIRAESKKEVCVLDLGCGKGGDMLKWKKSNVARVTFADIADVSLVECRNRYETPVRARFAAEFVHLDATKELLADKLPISQRLHDLVSSQFVIHYSFESYPQANTFMKNVSDSLRVGGYFVGTTTNGYELVKRWRASDSESFGNELFNIRFEREDKLDVPVFGVKFDFKLHSVVECPEYLVNFDALERIALKHNLKLVFAKTFKEYFEENAGRPEYAKLIEIMQSMERYYSHDGSRVTEPDYRPEEYEFINSRLEDPAFKAELGAKEEYGTMSKSEWDAITLYVAFAFVKVKPTDEDKEESVEDSKRNDTHDSPNEPESTDQADLPEQPTKRKKSESEEDDESAPKKKA